MDRDPNQPEDQPESNQSDEDRPPPFDPDPRLATYLERGGKKTDAEERFRREVEKSKKDD